MNQVKVRYRGKRLPFTIKMPWLSEHVTFGQSREEVMGKRDAERICREAPTDFSLVEEVEPDKKEKEKPVVRKRKLKKESKK